MGEKKKAGRPASYSAEYFPHYTNHDAEPHIRHIVRKWGLDGFSIYYMILEKLGSAQHHYLQYSTEEDKFDLYDQLRPADEKVIIEIIDYLITKQVLDKNLFEQGIIYSPFFVNTLSTLYSSRSRIPLIPETDNDGNITKRKVFEFSTEKYLYSTVNALFQEDYPANRTEDNNSEGNLRKVNPTESTAQNTSKNLGNKSPADSADGRIDFKDQDSKKSVSVSADKPSKTSESVKDIIKETAKLKGIANPLYPEYECNNPEVRAETGRNWGTILIESAWVKGIIDKFGIQNENLIELYNEYGRDKMLNNYAYTLLKAKTEKIDKPSGYFIQALKKDYAEGKAESIKPVIDEILRDCPRLE